MATQATSVQPAWPLMTYEIEIYEFREHWTFYATYKASTKDEAAQMARKEYPKKYYRVVY